MNFVNYLSKFLQNKAKKLTSVGLENSFAWTKKDALHVINELAAQDIAILGGDILKMLDNGLFEYTYDNWYIKEQSGLTWREYVKYSQEYSHSYILSYLQDSDDEWYFSLVAVDELEYQANSKARHNLS